MSHTPPGPDPDRLFGLQVFVVEDEILASMMLEDMLAEFGCIVAGLAVSVEEALSKVLATSEIDAAILDVNIGGRSIFPVADILTERHIPFVFSTGYPSGDLVKRYPASRMLAKPYEPRALAEILTEFVYEAP